MAEFDAAGARGVFWFRRLPGVRDAVAVLLVLAVVVLLGLGARRMLGPLVLAAQPPISLTPWALPDYALRTVVRMLAALAASLVFTFVYATLAAKSRRAEMILLPLLDVLQSVPILGYLSFTAVFFVSLFPGRALGPELAAIFAIFTSQAWNMTFSFYQALKAVPRDLDEVSRSFRNSAWQRFWRLEVPYALPGLIWNMMVSMSGGWFFVVASEAIAVGALHVSLPGIGSYVALAIEKRDLTAVGWAILAMLIVILLYDQILFRPLTAWAEKFRVEQTAGERGSRSVVLDLFRQSLVLGRLVGPVSAGLQGVMRARLALPRPAARRARASLPAPWSDVIWWTAVVAVIGYFGWRLFLFASPGLTWGDFATVAENGLLTLVRVSVLIALASLVWVPIGIAVGLRPKLAAAVRPAAQFLAAFPANLLYPVAVFLIIRFSLNPVIWLSPLMILGTQWYILFNVIAGASVFPGDLREAAASLRIRRWRWWRDIMLPGILPYYVTGAITASGGAWNASIISEAVTWGSVHLSASGLGAYIAQQTAAGDYPRIALGIAVMAVLVVATNRLVWQPLYAFAERRTRLD